LTSLNIRNATKGVAAAGRNFFQPCVRSTGEKHPIDGTRQAGHHRYRHHLDDPKMASTRPHPHPVRAFSLGGQRPLFGQKTHLTAFSCGLLMTPRSGWAARGALVSNG
jgi:hypothetical protein